MHVKGQGLPLHEPRLKQGLGITYGLSPTGADHLQSFHDTQYASEGGGLDYLKPIGLLEPIPPTELSSRKLPYMVYGQHWRSFFNMAVYCLIVPYGFRQMVDLVQGVTGWETSVFELLKAGERGTTLARVFNVREGLTKEDDRLPQRLFEPLPSGPLQGVALDADQAENVIQEYYGIMGWDSEGVPSRAKLDELNVGWAAAHLLDAVPD
jgi:aldehyde:ferredoxin oxidoreductase